MAKQLNVNLAFTADTGQAKQQIQALQQDLKNLVSATGPTKDFKLTKELVEAKEAAGQLGLALKNATTSTGSLDLSKFDQSLKASGMTLAEYRTKLSAMGPAGQQAFAKMAQSIVQAEVPLRRTNALLDQFKTTLVNTARWQLSSSMLHGFMGALQSAYGYAQDLNSSLNNIRIVTGATTDEMAVFANQANKAAQALSTSTTQYTDAALIYYQQGITDQKEIAERTETTIKLANVSRQSAEEVSQEMTAIWNNFDDGSHSLEYYADVITALGAATASSSEEISTGLEKFAAIAKTVGLSYEYATSALATITATTRQSADTVGTGLRTLFSRLESLSLGDTLEDGVDLNKYSEALEKVGVQVLDTSGELRQMDDILNDLGQHWGELGDAQKVALAQTVGGVRQYTNLIALMDNWDFMQQNLGVAQGSEGTLQKQADIYAESWEAAQKRVKAAAQALYSDLLDDDFFITLTNGFAEILKALDGFIDGIGGLRTVLPGVAALLMNAFGPQLAQQIDNTIFNMMRGTEQMKAFYDTKKQEAMQEASLLYTNPNSMGDQAAQAGLERQLELTYQLEDVANILSEEEIERLQTSIDTVASLNEQAEAMGRIADASKKSLQDQKASIIGAAALNAGGNMQNRASAASEASKQLKTVDDTIKPIAEAKVKMQELVKEFDKGNLDTFDQGLINIKDSLSGLSNSLPFVTNAYDQFIESGGENIDLARELAESTTLDEQAYLDVAEALDEYDEVLPEVNNNLQQYIQNSTQAATDAARSAQGIDAAGDAAARAEQKIKEAAENAGKQLGTTGQTFVTVFQGVSQITMGVSALANAFEILKSPDASGWEKFRTVIMGVSMGLPMIITGYNSLISTFEKVNAAIKTMVAAEEAQVAVENQNIIVTGIANGIMKLKKLLHLETAVAEEAETGATTTLTAAQWALNAAMDANPIGAVILAIAALIAIIAGAVGIIKLFIEAWNAYNTAAENAEFAAANLQKQFQETQQAYENLKTSIEDYHGALDAIDSLSKGTVEWKDAIRDSNTQALELIDTLGLIKDADYTIDKDGVIKINQEVLDKAIEERAQATEKAQMSAVMGQATAKKVRADADTENLARDSGQYAKVNTAIERLVNGDLKDQFSKNALSDEDLKDKLDINDDELISAIKENAQAQLQAADQYAMASEEAAKIAVANNKDIQKSGYADDMSKAAGTIYKDAYDAAYEKHSEELALGVSEKVFEQYAKLNGLDEKKGLEFEGRNKDGQLEYSYLDENNQRQKVEILEDEIAMTLAAAEAEQQLAETSTGLIDAFKNLDEAGTIGSEALKKFLTDRDLNSLKASELKEMAALTENGKKTKEYLGSQFGGEDKQLDNKEAQALGYDSAQAMVEAFNQGLSDAQSNIADAGKDLIPSFMEKAFDAVSENSDLGISGKTAIASAIDSALASGGNDAAKKLMNQFMEASEAGELTAEKIDEIAANAEKLNAVDLSTLTEQIAKVNSILNGLETGDSISADDYAALSEEQQSYFAMAMDGTYQLIGSAEELRDITSEANFEKFKQMGNEAANATNTYNTASDIAEAQGINALSESAYMGKGPEGSTAFDSSLLETQLGLLREYQGELDISNAKLAEWQEQLQNNTIDPAMLRDVAAAVGDINLSEEALAQGAADATAKQQEFQTAMALSAENTNELQQMLENGDINSEAFNKGLEKLHNTLDEDIDTEQYEELAEYFEEFGDKIKGVSKDMKGNKKASRELAKEISRFDAAVESVDENYNDWMRDLKKGDKNSTTHAKTIKGLRNAYGDLLDVSGDTLSKNFLENTKNLEDMAAAANGDEEAYNRLATAARQDIIANCKMSDEEFQAGFQDLMDKWHQGQNLDDIDVGANLDNGGFLQGLTEMVNAAGMTAQQATDYLSSMGVDAKVNTVSTPETETQEIASYTAIPHTATQTYSIPKVTGAGEEGASVSELTGTATYPYFTVSPHVETITTTKENSATALEVTSANKSSGGGFKYSNSGAGGGGSGGCFIAGTLISTNNGFLPIEKIQPGNIVLSYNEQTKQNEYSKVLQTMIHYLWTKLHKIYIGNEIIQTTEIHRFYIKRAGLAQWLPASELRAGDLMYLASGEWQAIDKIEIKKRFRKVYNFEVSNNHNYYVSETKILAHNKGGCFIAGTLVTTDQGFKNIENIQIGDIVLSYDEQKKQNVYSQVAQTMIHFVQESIYTLYIANETLKVTGIHRFFIKRNNSISWIHASDIQVGDFVLFANGTWNEIFKIESKFRFRKVYNFEVSNTHNYYVGKNQILAHNKGGRRGGGGRRSERMRIQKVNSSEGQERYYKVTKQLNVLEHAYDKIAKAADRAFGQQKIKNINQEIKAQDKLIKKQKEYLKEIQKYLKIDKQRLTGNKKGKTTQQYWSEEGNKFEKARTDIDGVTGKKINFDKNGVITNYNSIIKSINRWYNKEMGKIRKAYDEDDKKGKKRMEKIEAQREMMIENLQQYAETMELRLDEKAKLIEKQNELYDLKLARTELRLTLRIDVAEDSLKLIDNLLEQIGDSAYKAVNRIALISKQININANKFNAYKKDLQGLLSAHGLSKESKNIFNQIETAQTEKDILALADKLNKKGKWTDAEVENLRTVIDGLLDMNNSLIELRKSVFEEFGNVIEENIDRLDRVTDKMETLKNVTQSYKNIIDLTGKEFLHLNSEIYDSIEKENVLLATSSLEMSKQRLVQAQQWRQSIYDEYQEVRNSVKQLSDDEIAGWEERLKQADDYVQEMTDNYYSSWEEALEAVNQRFESSMENMANDFKKSMGGLSTIAGQSISMGLDGVQEHMELSKKIAETYVPTYEKMYQLNKLISDSQKAIDGSTNVKVQQELQVIQQKIVDARADENNMSQYQIDYLKQELELKKAQLALEEASQVKSQVRMSRDSEGNYSYVYTADQNKVQNAEDEYNAKLYEMQKLNEEYIQNIQDQLVTLQQDYISSLQEAANTYEVGSEAYYAAIFRITEEYQGYFNDIEGQLGLALENQTETETKHAELYTKITGDVYQANVALTTSWEETMLAAETGFSSLSDYAENWETNSLNAWETAKQAAIDWGTGIEMVYETAGTSIQTFATELVGEDGESGILGSINEKSKETITELQNTVMATTQALEDAGNALVQWEEQHSQWIQDQIELNNQYIATIEGIIAAWSKLENKVNLDAAIAKAEKRLDTSTKRKNDLKRTRGVQKVLNSEAHKRYMRSKKTYNTAKKSVRGKKYNRIKSDRRKLESAKRKKRDAYARMKRARRGSKRYKEARRRYESAKRRYSTARNRYDRTFKRLGRTARRTWRNYSKVRTNYNKKRAVYRRYVRNRLTKSERKQWKKYLRATAQVRKDTKALANLRKREKTYNNTVNNFDFGQNNSAISTANNTSQASEEQINEMVDTMASAVSAGLSNIVISPKIEIPMPKELQQYVTIALDLPDTDFLTFFSTMKDTVLPEAASQYVFK